MANAQTLAQAIADLDEENALAAVCAILDARPELAPAVVSYAVPELTYPPSKALVERRSSGYIMSFQPEKGFGFIACPELCEVFGKDVFLSCFQIGNFTVGSQVNFAVALNKEYKPQAYDLREPDGHPGQKGGEKGGQAKGSKGWSDASKGWSDGSKGWSGGKGSKGKEPVAQLVIPGLKGGKGPQAHAGGKGMTAKGGQADFQVEDSQ
ncbi:unnamed protein product, partial [Polarella glacialis]